MVKSYQDMVLNKARRQEMPVTVFLTSGFQIRGIVRGFDNYVILLESESKQQMIYKHAVSTIIPLRPLSGIIEAYKKIENDTEPDESEETLE
ncbi:MAG: RNA chaperone Hfq [Defluviitaleaceae bacterium]|nr:RNA chaperone Hfq [Defluviitaleaceae bacterium]